MKALNRWSAISYVIRRMEWDLVHLISSRLQSSDSELVYLISYLKSPYFHKVCIWTSFNHTFYLSFTLFSHLPNQLSRPSVVLEMLALKTYNLPGINRHRHWGIWQSDGHGLLCKRSSAVVSVVVVGCVGLDTTIQTFWKAMGTHAFSTFHFRNGGMTDY